MTDRQDQGPAWWAKGLLFENCNCQLLCRGHLSFKNLCDHQRCLVTWAIHIKDGVFGDVRLNGINMVIAVDSPQRMFDGDWIESIYIDKEADSAQRRAVEDILTGRAGGPWQVLSGLVGTWLETRHVPMTFIDQGKTKAMRIDGIMESVVTAIRAADKVGVVTLENLYNKIHPPKQVVSTGVTRFDDQGIKIENDHTFALYSDFAWQGP